VQFKAIKVLCYLVLALHLTSAFPSRDTETLIGLPRPIHESVKTLKQVRL